jgi:ribosomal protein S1
MSMLEIDSIVQAVVKQSGQGGGILLSCGEHDIYVDRAEMFWQPWPDGRNSLEMFSVGSEVPIRVLGYMYPLHRVLGSIKRVDPEANPYRKLSRYDPGTVFRGRVGILPHHRDVMVNLFDPNVVGILRTASTSRSELKYEPNIELSVTIHALDLFRAWIYTAA